MDCEECISDCSLLKGSLVDNNKSEMWWKDKKASMKMNPASTTDKLQTPSQLYRKDLISAMKLPDAEILHADDYITIVDTWRQDWEKGVQVPVNSQAPHLVSIQFIKENELLNGSYAFKLPKKLLRSSSDDNYKAFLHELHITQKLADEVCRYDLDFLDVTWLQNFNQTRKLWGEEELDAWWMERVIEEIETQCYMALKGVHTAGMEFDEDVVCDVCRLPDVEDGNEMVFCDVCDVGVHQACYGVAKIPDGSWVCRTCAVGLKPRCALCTTQGGAMKITTDGAQWAHLSCAIWLPEVSIGDSCKMEPVANISQIPMTRWNLICVVCKERSGACIQCCIPKCKTSFHVTCAFSRNYDMSLKLDDGDKDLQVQAYCGLHTKDKEAEIKEDDEDGVVHSSRRMQKISDEFYRHVNVGDVARVVGLNEEVVSFIQHYWIIKRKANFNRPLLTAKVEEGDLLVQQRQDVLKARLRMFIHLRQDLERVRNLCYMVTKRERIRATLYQLKRHLFKHQCTVLQHHLTNHSNKGKNSNCNDNNSGNFDFDAVMYNKKEFCKNKDIHTTPTNFSSKYSSGYNKKELEAILQLHHYCLSIYDKPQLIMQTAQYYNNKSLQKDRDRSCFKEIQDTSNSSAASQIFTNIMKQVEDKELSLHHTPSSSTLSNSVSNNIHHFISSNSIKPLSKHKSCMADFKDVKNNDKNYLKNSNHNNFTCNKKININANSNNNMDNSNKTNQSKSFVRVEKRKLKWQSHENPYAKKTYKNFAWMLAGSKKRKLEGSNKNSDVSSKNEDMISIDVESRLENDGSCVASVSVSANKDCFSSSVGGGNVGGCSVGGGISCSIGGGNGRKIVRINSSSVVGSVERGISGNEQVGSKDVDAYNSFHHTTFISTASNNSLIFSNTIDMDNKRTRCIKNNFLNTSYNTLTTNGSREDLIEYKMECNRMYDSGGLKNDVKLSDISKEVSKSSQVVKVSQTENPHVSLVKLSDLEFKKVFFEDCAKEMTQISRNTEASKTPSIYDNTFRIKNDGNILSDSTSGSLKRILNNNLNITSRKKDKNFKKSLNFTYSTFCNKNKKRIVGDDFGKVDEGVHKKVTMKSKIGKDLRNENCEKTHSCAPKKNYSEKKSNSSIDNKTEVLRKKRNNCDHNENTAIKRNVANVSDNKCDIEEGNKKCAMSKRGMLMNTSVAHQTFHDAPFGIIKMCDNHSNNNNEDNVDDNNKLEDLITNELSTNNYITELQKGFQGIKRKEKITNNIKKYPCGVIKSIQGTLDDYLKNKIPLNHIEEAQTDPTNYTSVKREESAIANNNNISKSNEAHSHTPTIIQNSLKIVKNQNNNGDDKNNKIHFKNDKLIRRNKLLIKKKINCLIENKNSNIHKYLKTNSMTDQL